MVPFDAGANAKRYHSEVVSRRASLKRKHEVDVDNRVIRISKAERCKSGGAGGTLNEKCQY